MSTSEIHLAHDCKLITLIENLGCCYFGTSCCTGRYKSEKLQPYALLSFYLLINSILYHWFLWAVFLAGRIFHYIFALHLAVNEPRAPLGLQHL